jgi:hypothetical protein
MKSAQVFRRLAPIDLLTNSAKEVPMQRLKCILLCVLLTLTAVPLVAGETVSDQQRGFRVTVPDGFVPDAEKVQGAVIHAFQRPPAADQKFGTLILISRLDGVLDRKKIDPKMLAEKGPQVTIVTEKWKEFDIECFRVPEQAGGLQLVTFNAQVPLKPEAIQIAVGGEAAKENELRDVLRSVLGSLDGQTNWLTSEQRVSKVAEGVVRLSITVGILALIGVAVVVGIAVVIRQAVRRGKSTRGLAE